MNNNESPDKVVRFRKSEIRLHWAIVIPFIICYGTALILVIFYNPDPTRPYRDIVSWIHRISGICLCTFPLLSTLRNKRDMKVFFYNIRHSLSWTRDDFKWLSLMGLASISKKISLPDQGKFNAAEKMHFISLIITYPLYLLTGILIWNTNSALLPWLLHFTMAVIATPFMFSHMFMAILNPNTRIALSGMTSGLVDRHYVQSHHAKWYREEFEGALNDETMHEENENPVINDSKYAAQEVKS